MTGRNLKRIGGVIAGLLVIWLGGRLLRSGDAAGAGGLRLAGVAADSADTIVIASVRETLTVVRATNGTWTTNGFPGSSSTALELLTALKDSTPAELVARSAASFERLGVDSVAARRVRMTRGPDVVLDVLVSERGPDGQSAYVRLPGDSTVYAQRGQLGPVVRRGLDEWREKTVALVTPDSVGEVELMRGTRRTVLQRRDGGWRHGSGGADSAAVSRLLERYRIVSAAGFPSAAQIDSTFRGRVERRATLRDRAGAVLLALEFDSVAGAYWVRRHGADSALIYRFNTWDVDEMVPADSTLRVKR